LTLDQILEEWKKDCTVDKTELGDESLRTIPLHSKYITLYKQEKLKLIKIKKELAKLHLAKYEFYTMGPDEETERLGWKLPPRGAIIKNESGIYMDADKELIDANLKVSVQQEKVDLLVDIVKEVQNRRWAIKSAIEWQKWTQGG
jgi:hypothetical protein